jgi:hypothetical protein
VNGGGAGVGHFGCFLGLIRQASSLKRVDQVLNFFPQRLQNLSRGLL